MAGAPTQIVARVGSDPAGIAVISEFDSMGVVHKNLVAEGTHTEASRLGVLQMIDAIKEKDLSIFFDPATVGGMSQVPIDEVRSWLPLMNTLLLSAPTVIIKRGSEGATAKSRGGHLVTVPAVSKTVIDTTGAGDSFAGGYLATWLTNRDLRACMQAGAEVAAQCVAIVGARPQVTTAL